MSACGFYLILLSSWINSVWTLREPYPDPAFVLFGPNGAGKSSLANAFLGFDPSNASCPFQVCEDDGDTESCTKDTNIGTGKWLGSGSDITVKFHVMLELMIPKSSGS